MDINSNGDISFGALASGSPTLTSIEAVYSLSTTGDAAAEGA
jgi:hypothetical protein